MEEKGSVGQVNQSCWYAIRTHSRHEKVVRDQLAGRGIENLVPTVVRLSQWKDRKKEIQFPLFPGYCFARFVWHDRMPVLQASGVVDVVGRDSYPEPISEKEIEAIKMIVGSRRRYGSHPYQVEGVPVEVIRGPLQGMTGSLIRNANGCQLVIAVHLIRQAASVEIDAADVAPI